MKITAEIIERSREKKSRKWIDRRNMRTNTTSWQFSTARSHTSNDTMRLERERKRERGGGEEYIYKFQQLLSIKSRNGRRATVNRPLIAEILRGAWHVFILTGESLIVAAMGTRRWTAVGRYSYGDKTTSKDYGHVFIARARSALLLEIPYVCIPHSYLFSMEVKTHHVNINVT